MRFKIIASILAVALLTVGAYGGEDDNEKKERKPARWQPRPCRICTSWNPLPKQLSRKRRDTPFSTTWG